MIFFGPICFAAPDFLVTLEAADVIRNLDVWSLMNNVKIFPPVHLERKKSGGTRKTGDMSSSPSI